MKQHHGDVFSDDGTLFETIDSENQRLWIRVGTVFHGKETDPEPGIWILYQEECNSS